MLFRSKTHHINFSKVDFTPRRIVRNKEEQFNNDKISSPIKNSNVNTPQQSTRSFGVKTDGPKQKNRQIHSSSF